MNRAFTDHDVELGSKRFEIFGHDGAKPLPMLHVVASTHCGHRLAPNNQLRRAVTSRLEQHRIESNTRLQTACTRLKCLRTADLSAVQRDHGVVRHVLRLERRHSDASTRQHATQSGHKNALACVGSSAGYQQSAAHLRTQGRVRISAPVSVTTKVCSNCAVHLRSLVTTVQPSSQIS